MPLVDLKDMLRHARAKGFAVGAYDAVDSNFVAAIIEGAEAARAPVIVSFAESHFAHYDFPALVAAAESHAKRARVPVALFLDHGASRESAVEAIRLGVNGVMVDASHLPFDENVAATRSVVGMAHGVGVPVEGELVPGRLAFQHDPVRRVDVVGRGVVGRLVQLDEHDRCRRAPDAIEPAEVLIAVHPAGEVVVHAVAAAPDLAGNRMRLRPVRAPVRGTTGDEPVAILPAQRIEPRLVLVDRPAVRQAEVDKKALVVHGVHLHREPEASHIAQAGGAPALLLCPRERGQQDRNQQGENRHNHEQFDQRKSSVHRCTSGFARNGMTFPRRSRGRRPTHTQRAVAPRSCRSAKGASQALRRNGDRMMRRRHAAIGGARGLPTR